MPLTAIQKSVIRILKLHRSEHTFVAGGAALNRNWPRLSDDMDIFNDIRGRLPRLVEPELEALRKAGFSIGITVEDEFTVEVIVQKDGEETMVQWMDDPETCKRFFPAINDHDFGFRLHDADNSVNKVLCSSRRHSAPRDAVDLMNIVEHYAPLGPLVWAISGKDSNMPPPQVLRGIRKNAFGYSKEEIETVRMEDGSTPVWGLVRETLDASLETAANYCENIAPIDYTGCLFVDQNEMPVEADEKEVTNGQANALVIRDFSGVPVINS